MRSCSRPVRGVASRGCSHATTRPRSAGGRPARFCNHAEARHGRATGVRIRQSPSGASSPDLRGRPDAIRRKTCRSHPATSTARAASPGRAKGLALLEGSSPTRHTSASRSRAPPRRRLTTAIASRPRGRLATRNPTGSRSFLSAERQCRGALSVHWQTVAVPVRGGVLATTGPPNLVTVTRELLVGAR